MVYKCVPPWTSRRGDQGLGRRREGVFWGRQRVGRKQKGGKQEMVFRTISYVRS